MSEFKTFEPRDDFSLGEEPTEEPPPVEVPPVPTIRRSLWSRFIGAVSPFGAEGGGSASSFKHPLASTVTHKIRGPGIAPPLAGDEFNFGLAFGFTANELRKDLLIGQAVRGFADQLRFGEAKDLNAYTPGAGVLSPGSGNSNIPPINAPLTAEEIAFAGRVAGLTPEELGADRRKALFIRGFADQLLAHYGSNVTLHSFGANAGQTYGGKNDPPYGGKNKGGFNINIDLSHVDWTAVAAAVAPALNFIPGVGTVAFAATEAGLAAAKVAKAANR